MEAEPTERGSRFKRSMHLGLVFFVCQGLQILLLSASRELGVGSQSPHLEEITLEKASTRKSEVRQILELCTCYLCEEDSARTRTHEGLDLICLLHPPAMH